MSNKLVIHFLKIVNKVIKHRAHSTFFASHIAQDLYVCHTTSELDDKLAGSAGLQHRLWVVGAQD